MKLLIIGVDGATFNLLLPWARKGKLKTFQKLLTAGVSSVLWSPMPITPAGWTSIITGKNVGKHGLLDFIKRERRSYKLRLTSARDRHALALWELISHLDDTKRMIIINYPFTYPLNDNLSDNCILVADCTTPSVESKFTNPDKLKLKLIIKLGTYIFDLKLSPVKSPAEYLAGVRTLTNFRARTSKLLMRDYDWDLFIIIFMGIDMVSHAFWKYQTMKNSIFRDAIFSIYQQMDNIIDSLYSYAQRKYGKINLMILSDHGMGKLTKHVYLNKWLLMNKYLQLKLKSKLSLKLSQWLLTSHTTATTTATDNNNSREDNLSALDSIVNWHTTKAFSWGNLSSITLNLKGREPLGIVKPAEQQELISELKRKLKMTLGVDITRIVHKSELFTGPYVQELPDLYLVLNDFEYMGKGATPTYAPIPKNTLFEEPELSATHRPEGVLITYGNCFRKGAQAVGSQVSIYDITPTVLYLFDLPLLPDFDGVPLIKTHLKPEIWKQRQRRRGQLEFEKINGKNNRRIDTNDNDNNSSDDYESSEE